MFDWLKRRPKATPPPQPQGPVDAVHEISASELKAMLASANPPTVLDVREAYELAAGTIPGSTHIPLATIPHRLGDLPRDRPIVAVCTVGERSHAVAEYLREKGFEHVANLRGGLYAWEILHRRGE